MTRPLSFSGPVTTARVRLSRLTLEALPEMATWLQTALAPEWRLEDLETAVRAGSGVLTSDATDQPIGVAIVLLDVPARGAATVPFLAIKPPQRFRGLGGEAGLALERHLRERYGVGDVYAPVPDGRGLAVYFWLRLGYRPLSSREAPGPLIGLSDVPVGGIWMLRGSDSG